MTEDRQARVSNAASSRGGQEARASNATLPSLQDALALGLTESEYELICEKQGRAPNQVELAMYSLLWSEHCAYKHSKKLLRTLPTEGEHVVMGPGENAGAVDLGDGLVCAFKVESHNHPSAVEPFQGAATGVGGILRDIFAIGARPIAVLDSLRFGEPETGLPYPFNKVEEDKGSPGREKKTNTQHPPESGATAAKLAGNRSKLAANRSRYLLDRAVAGIAHYGNSIGVPTIGGEVYFEAPYEQNCLVNAMALGIGERDKLVTSAAAGIGNTVVLFGASTGRDGIGGASVLASAELDLSPSPNQNPPQGADVGDSSGEGPKGHNRRSTVQVGDPFEEKKLMECSLELLQRGLIVSLQDLGAAGLTSSAAEMASKGEVGIDIDVAKVPLREPGMEPFEIMVSESQERMLCVVEPASVAQVLELCEKWEVGGAAIGAVTGGGRMRVFDRGELVGDMPVRALVDDCPLYDLEPVKPASTPYRAPQALPSPPEGLAAGSPVARVVRGVGAGTEILLALLASPNIASRRPLFEQYDSVVQSRTVCRPEQADAAVLAIRPLDGSDGGPAHPGPAHPGPAHPGPTHPGPGRGPIPGIAVSIDCNGRRVAADPYTGTVAAALECASNLACAGAEPLGTTNNLNFGNPEKPHIAWQLTESVRGLGDACRALAAPVVGGNVSLYNEGASAGPVYPTPVVGMVGRLPDVHRAGRSGFARAGDTIAIVGPFAPSLAASELAKLRGEQLPDGLPAIDVDAVIAAQAAVREAVRSGAASSAHDIAEGGVAVALAECCLAGGLGARIEIDGDIEHLFGECSGAFIVSGHGQALESMPETAVKTIGVVEGGSLRIGGQIEVTLAEMEAAHGALRQLFE
jgi:phosphoribosylformylglycinamidine synthase